MLLKRTIVSLIFLPIGIYLHYAGGALYDAFIALILALAAWEFAKLFLIGKLHPASYLLVAGTVALAIGRAVDGFESAPWLISLVVLAAMTFHLLAYERGDDQAGTRFYSDRIGGILFRLYWCIPDLFA